jgi:hypothetical protein
MPTVDEMVKAARKRRHSVAMGKRAKAAQPWLTQDGTCKYPALNTSKTHSLVCPRILGKYNPPKGE